MTRTGGEPRAGRGGPTAFQWLRSYGLILALLIFSLIVPPTMPAAAQTTPRAAMHEDFGRMVFDWDQKVTYSAQIKDQSLVVAFDLPIKGDVQNVARALGKLLKGATLSDDRKSVSFSLARPLLVNASVGNNNSIVIDLREAGGGKSPNPAEPAKSEPAASPTVEAHAGDHGSYARLVFDWPMNVGYKVETQGGRATIAFSKPGKIDIAALRAELPADLTIAAAGNDGKGLTLTLQIPAKAKLHHFTAANKIVVDMVRGGDAVADPVKLPPLEGDKPAAPAKTALTPVKPTPNPGEKPTAAPPAAMPALPASIAPPAIATASANAPPINIGPPPISAAAAKAAAAPLPPGKSFSLSIPMTKPAAAAVFQRAGYMWLVFDRRQEIDTTLLRRLGGEAVLSVEQLQNKDATVLRLVVQPDFYPSLRKEGLLWVVDLTEQFAKPKDIIPVVAPANLPGGSGMSLKAPESGNLITVIDPEVGDMIKVVPVIPVNQGVYPGRDTPDLEVLPTAQGIALIPHVDGLDIRSARAGVNITTQSGAGLRFSSELDVAPRDAAGNSTAKILDIGSWKRGPPEAFEANRKIVLKALNNVSSSKRALANMQAARFYLANGYGAEALGFAHLASLDQPDLADQPSFRAMKGAAELLMSQTDLAVTDLDSPALQNDPESQLWRAAAHTMAESNGDGQPAAWNKLMAEELPVIKPYPHRLKWMIASLAAQSAIAAGDDQAAAAALNQLDRDAPEKMEIPERAYLHGQFDQGAGRFEKAIDEYDAAADGENRKYRALAKFAETELSLRTRKITAKEAADQLDKLRYSWREQSFEFHLLLRYAELERDAQDFPAALRALRSLISYYPDDKDAPKAVQMMTDIFNRLYLDGQADQMPPVSAIGLFDEFRDLTPSGPQGDEMIRKLADRLVKVDLLDRAAELLKHQVTYRLQGLDKARVGAQLALVDLMNRQPQAALEGLAISDQTGLPADLEKQRRQLRARALSDLDRTDEAIAALANDNSPEAAQLRSETHWKAQDWQAAAADFETMLPRPERGAKLDEAAARLCLNWATALVLANDERALASLRRNYFPAIAGTPYQEGFNLLTSALDRDTPNLPEIVAKIKEVEGFKSFLSDYRKRLQAGALSGIN